jgi:hypothetical protein
VIEMRNPKPRTVSAAPFAERMVHHAAVVFISPSRCIKDAD